MPAISATNVSKTYGRFCALDKVSVQLKPGEIAAIIGSSGCGKSTFLRILSGVERPDSGSVCHLGNALTYDDRQISASNGNWPNITAVFQQVFLWPHVSALKNITLSLRRQGSDRQNQKWLIEMAQRLGIGDVLHRYPNQLSGGERQRVAFIRAVALKPKCLLLDEVTASLDVEARAAMINEINSLASHGTAIAFVTHWMGFVRRYAHKVHVLDRGRCVESGTPELFDHPESAALTRLIAASRLDGSLGF